MNMDNIDERYSIVFDQQNNEQFIMKNADECARQIHRLYFDGLLWALQQLNEPRVLRLIEINPERLALIMKLHSGQHEIILDARTPYDDAWVLLAIVRTKMTMQIYLDFSSFNFSLI